MIETTISEEQQSQAYTSVETWCHERISTGHPMLFSRTLFHKEMKSASAQFHYSFEAIHSLFRNAHVSHMKRTAHMVKSQATRHVQSYLNGTSILNIANKCNYPPSMMARLIVENVAILPSSNKTIKGNNLTGMHRKFITEAIRHPEKLLGDASTSVSAEYLFSESKGKQHRKMENESICIPLSRLSLEVKEAVGSDPMYGPDHDKIRHNIGIEYERLLEQMLDSMKIPFETEEVLRARGTAKTPDILLSCPVGLKVKKRHHKDDEKMHGHEATTDNDDGHEWKMICWIDSKASALYGDVDTHTNSVLPQVESYVHRFGPGLIIYWFGHAPLSRLGDSHGDVLITDDLPDVFMLPTGEFRRREDKQMEST